MDFFNDREKLAGEYRAVIARNYWGDAMKTIDLEQETNPGLRKRHVSTWRRAS